MVNPRLTAIAAEEDWFDVGRQLEAAMAEPKRFGCATSDDVLREVANLRAQHPESLKRTVRGARVLATHYPEAAGRGPEGPGLMHVLLLDQLRELGAPLTQHFKMEVLSGRVTQRALEQRVAEARAAAETKAERGERPRPAGHRRARSRDFEAAVREFVEHYPELFCDDPSATVTSGYKVRPVPFDIALWSGEELVGAIEVKSSNLRTHPKQIAEIVGSLHLLTYIARQVWLVVAPQWEYNLPNLSEVHASLRLNPMKLAVLKTKKGDDEFRQAAMKVVDLDVQNN
jgi:hypothetical protein